MNWRFDCRMWGFVEAESKEEALERAEDAVRIGEFWEYEVEVEETELRDVMPAEKEEG
jgi:hypothetical protein